MRECKISPEKNLGLSLPFRHALMLLHGMAGFSRDIEGYIQFGFSGLGFRETLPGELLARPGRGFLAWDV